MKPFHESGTGISLSVFFRKGKEQINEFEASPESNFIIWRLNEVYILDDSDWEASKSTAQTSNSQFIKQQNEMIDTQTEQTIRLIRCDVRMMIAAGYDCWFLWCSGRSPSGSGNILSSCIILLLLVEVGEEKTWETARAMDSKASLLTSFLFPGNTLPFFGPNSRSSIDATVSLPGFICGAILNWLLFL